MISKEEKIKLIVDIAKKNDIAAYEIGQKTSVSASSVQKIFSGEQKNPRNRTLNIILHYLENAIVGSKGDLEVREEHTTAYRNKHKQRSPESLQFENLGIKEKLNEIYALLKSNQTDILSNKKDISTSINNNLERFEIVRIQVEKINAKTKSNKKLS